MDEQRVTSTGTPWASAWDTAWAERVEAAEAALDRRICGARTLSGEPCTLTSDHPTGRCRYHGGTDAIGAPVGNQNARTHGLYARRLQRCGTHCPMWEHCPFAGDDVLALEPPERPICAYEAAEYEEVLDALSAPSMDEDPNVDVPRSKETQAATGNKPQARSAVRENPSHSPNPRTHSLHNLALLQVMLSRAAAALSVTGLTDEVRSETDRYQLRTTKVHPALQAFLRISRELRAVQAASERESAQTPVTEADAAYNRSFASFFTDEMVERTDRIMEEALEAETRCEEYMRRLEWIAHDYLGPQWREHEPIREFALSRAVPHPGAPIHDPRFTTPHAPPNEHPPPLTGGMSSEDPRGP